MEGRPSGVRSLRLAGLGAAVVVLNLAALALSTVDAPFGVSGGELVGVAISVPSAPTPSAAPPTLPPPARGAAREDRGRPEPGGVRGIVFSPDGRTGWQFPRRPPEGPRGPDMASPPPQTVVRPLAPLRAGLDGAALYLATFAAVLGSGFGLVLLAPERVGRLRGALEGGLLQLARLLAIGAVAYVGAAALTALLILIITGIPLAAALVIALSVATMLGVVGVATAVGGRLLTWARVRRRRPLTDFLVGAILLVPLAATPLLGWLVAASIAMIGFGAVLITRFGAVHPSVGAFDRTV